MHKNHQNKHFCTTSKKIFCHPSGRRNRNIHPWGSNDHGHRNNVDNRSEEDASISTSNERGVTPGRDSTVGEGHRELFGNNEELRGRKDSVARSTSSFGICGARGDEMSAVQKSGGLVMSTSQGLQTCGRAGTSSYGRGRSESPATSVWRCGIYFFQ